MTIELDNPAHAADFIRLNEQWISTYFALEAADHALAAHPFRIVENGGHILSLVDASHVVGVCALFKEGDGRYQLARMAVAREARGLGYGEQLITAALALAQQHGATSVFLLSNTLLTAAIGLYRKHGFVTVSECQHPVYARCNIVMEKHFAEVKA